MLRLSPSLLRHPLAVATQRFRGNRRINTMAEPVLPNFIPLKDSGDTTDAPSGFRFRLVSYNILAQVYVKSSYFPHSPPSCLKWKTRSQAILSDIKNLGADFICLQELDEYDSFYKRNMENFGYLSLYIKRSGQKRDGCGIFYKHNSAQLLDKQEIDYNDLVNYVNDLDIQQSGGSTKETTKKNSHVDLGDTNDPRVRLKRDCVGLLAAFKLNDSSNHVIVVANTHIYWDPEWIDVKLAQAKHLLSQLALFKEAVSKKFDCTPSVIVAGDFNSTPGDEVYQYLVSSSDSRRIGLCSLYASNGGEPPFTNCTPGFTGTLDYIFLSEARHVNPVSLLKVPGPESPNIIGGLPNHQHPSDHLPIGGDFVVLQSSIL